MKASIRTARGGWLLVLLCVLGAVLAPPGLAADFKIIVPAAPGGGWDQLGRAVQASLQAGKLADRVQVTNAAGAGGTIGLAQLINNSKGEPGTLMVSGEYEVLVVPASSNLKSMADLLAAYKANPSAVSWAGGLAGGVDQLTAGMIIQAIGGESSKFNYVAFGSGGEVLAQTLGGHVTVGLGGYNEFAAQISAGKLRALAITSDKRLPGVNIPTLKEQGINVEFVNWRGLMAAPGISDAQRAELVKTALGLVKK